MKITLYPKYLIRSMFVHGRRHFFAAGYKVLYPEYSRHGMTPWQHYVIDGKRKGNDNGSHPSDISFFREGYEAEYPDVKASGADPWCHYAEKGLSEGRDNGMHPNAELFFPEGYLVMYPDVAESGIDPWHHYALSGKKEGRDNGLHPDASLFFPEGYLEMYPDVSGSGMDAWHHYVLIGRNLGRDNGNHPDSTFFFAEGYLEMYPDTVTSGLDPWHHYVMHGKNEGRDSAVIRELAFLTCPTNQRKNKFLLISRYWVNEGVPIWRVQFLKEYLEKHLAVEACIEYRQALSTMFIKNIQECRCVIFSRPENDAFFELVYKYCHNNHIKFYIDVDDLLLPDYASFELGGVKSKQACISARELSDQYRMSRVQQCLPFAMADGLICSTDSLAGLYSKYLKVVTHTHHNLISRAIFNGISEQIKQYKDSQNQILEKDDAFRLHFLVADGACTHLYDLSTVLMELIVFLKRNPDIQLTLLGMNLTNSGFLKKNLGKQLRVIPRVSYSEMLYIYSINDLLIVPLDLNVFNECKSNIKFIEAAIVGKPCLVRDIYEFSKDITDGESGLLYKDPADFTKKLEWISENSDKLKVLGNAAHEYVSKNLTIDYKDQADLDFFASLLKE